MIVEKPFGRDLESFRQLEEDLGRSLTEDQMYRIDHYLGKELIENLTVIIPLLPIFSPLRIRCPHLIDNLTAPPFPMKSNLIESI